MKTNTKYILFSPVGRNDPMSANYDGAMLHIIRHIRPYKVYLYLTKGMLAQQTQDSRFTVAISKLAEKLGIQTEVKILEHPEDAAPHLFDYYYDKFSKAISCICQENPELKSAQDAVLTLNLSSGTPAMKGALYTISKIGDVPASCIAYQVSDPNPDRERRGSKSDGIYDIDREWRNNKDNEIGATNRTSFTFGDGIMSVYYRRLIQSYVDEFNYDAALTLYNKLQAISNFGGNNKKVYALLQGACERKKGRLNHVGNYFKEAGITEPFFANSAYRAVEEYILLLDIKRLRGEYADFIRAISPVIRDLFRYMLKNFGVKKIGAKESTEDMKTKIIALCNSKGVQYNSIALYADRLRNAEYSCRNVAAHEIASVDEVWIQDRCGISPEEIVRMLKNFVEKLDDKLKETDWDSYKIMNGYIQDALNSNE